MPYRLGLNLICKPVCFLWIFTCWWLPKEVGSTNQLQIRSCSILVGIALALDCVVGYPSPCVLGNSVCPSLPFPRAGLQAHAHGVLQRLVSNTNEIIGSPSVFFLEESKSKPGMAVPVVLLRMDPFSSKSQEEPLKADVALVTPLQLGMRGGLDSASHSAFDSVGGGRTWQGCLAWCRLYLSFQTWELKCLSVYGGR